VLPDTLGGIDPSVYNNIPPRLPADIIADAQRTLVVRDGVASFFYNPEDPLSYLQQTVQGLPRSRLSIRESLRRVSQVYCLGKDDRLPAIARTRSPIASRYS